MPEDRKFGDEEPEVTEETPPRSYTREGLEEAGAGFLQALGDGLGVLLDRSRNEIESVARTGKARYDLLQAQRDRDTLYRRLGQAVFELVESGELDHPRLEPPMDKIRDANDRIAKLEDEHGTDHTEPTTD